MRKPMIAPLVAGLVLGCSATALGQEQAAGYTARDLLSPCQEADNDARWGEAAETECEQYILGFIDGLAIAGMVGVPGGICPPPENVADEARWAFMLWVHKDFSKRKAMPAGKALLAALKEAFPCAE